MMVTMNAYDSLKFTNRHCTCFPRKLPSQPGVHGRDRHQPAGDGPDPTRHSEGADGHPVEGNLHEGVYGARGSQWVASCITIDEHLQ